MTKLDSCAARQDQTQDIDPGFDAVTLEGARGEAHILEIQSELGAHSLVESGLKTTYSSEPEDLGAETDLDSRVLSAANVLSFPKGAVWQSLPEELDQSHAIDQPESAGRTGSMSFSSEAEPEREDSLSITTYISLRSGEVTRRRAA